MKQCILLGDRSDIGKALIPFLEADGWNVTGWNRDTPEKYARRYFPQWDLVLCALGRVAPVGHWADVDPTEFDDCVRSNILLPVRLLREVWHNRLPNASVCFFAGSNPQKIMSGYSPYHCGKMALLKAVEQIDYESPDCKVFALGPGYVKTKIHKATLDANWQNERIARGDDGTPIERIWGCLKWCINEPKDAVGGRNICVSDPWDGPQFDKSRFDMALAEELRQNPSMYKLRRIE